MWLLCSVCSVSKERERVGRDLKYHSPFAKRGERQTLFDILVNFRCTSFFGCSFPFLTPLKKCAEQNQRSPKILLLRISWSLSIDFPKKFALFSGSKKGIVSSNFWKGFSFGKSLQARKLVEKSITKEGSYAITIRQSRQYGETSAFSPVVPMRPFPGFFQCNGSIDVLLLFFRSACFSFVCMYQDSNREKLFSQTNWDKLQVSSKLKFWGTNWELPQCVETGKFMSGKCGWKKKKKLGQDKWKSGN